MAAHLRWCDRCRQRVRVLRTWERRSDEERRVLEALLAERTVVRDTNAEHRDARTFGERVSDRVAGFGGSWAFIILFFLFLVGWAVLNSEVLGPQKEAFDPYPYIFLNLMLSMLAAVQAPIILMAQNRAANRDRLSAANDYQVNLKAELALTFLIGELCRRIGDERLAREWFSRVADEVTNVAGQRWIVDVARQQRDEPREWFA